MNDLVALPTYEERFKTLRELCLMARSHFGQDTIIAGGAPRDMLSGIAWKDIDIFVLDDDLEFTDDEFNIQTPFMKRCWQFAKRLHAQCTFRAGSPEYGKLVDLCDIASPDYTGVIQVVAIDHDPTGDVLDYDFGLSQVFLTPDGLFMTEAAARDRFNKTITYMPGKEDDHAAALRSKARLARLRAKYFGWRFVNCEALDELEDHGA